MIFSSVLMSVPQSPFGIDQTHKAPITSQSTSSCFSSTVLLASSCSSRMVQSAYESLISEWGALEAIVLQQDREINAANMARYKLCIATRQKDQRDKHGQVQTLYCSKTERSTQQTWPGTNFMLKQDRKINAQIVSRTYFMLTQDRKINAANIVTYILYVYARQKDHCGKHGQAHTLC